MTFPLIIENTEQLNTLDAVLGFMQNNVTSYKTAINETGAILFRGFPVKTPEDFDQVSELFGYGDFTYQDSLSNAVRINFTPRVFTANEAPQDVEIYLHHEMAQTPLSPEKIFFCCLSAAESGGATPLCRSDKLFAAYTKEHPKWAKAFADHGLKYTTQMPAENDAESGQGRSWKSTLSVNSIEGAEKKLQSLGYTWEWQPDNSLKATSPALPATHKLPDGSTSFFNQVIAAYLGWNGVRENPDSALCFGNDTSIPPDALQAAADMAQDFTIDLAWQDGDIALVDNTRIMHGRRPYAGTRKRQVLVCLARD